MRPNHRNHRQNHILREIISRRNRRMYLFRSIPQNEQGFALLELPGKVRKDILSKLGDNELLDILNYLDSDEASDILQKTSEKRRERIVNRLSDGIKEKVEYLLRFDPKTAAGMMSLNYIEVKEDADMETVSEMIKRHEKVTGKVPTVLVVDGGYLVGELPIHFLVTAKKTDKVRKYVRRIPSIKYNSEKSDVINAFRRHPHSKIVVLDDNKSIMGIIYSDDIINLIQKESLDRLRNFAGVSREEDALDGVLTKVRYRYKWLIINLGTAFLAASIVGLFENTIAAFTLLAVYMPIVAGMGGNAGTQTLAVMVRGLALKEIDLKTAARPIANEIAAGAVNGVINGLIVAAVAIFWNKSPVLGLIIGLAMVINLVVAGFFGAVVPLLMKKLGKDPASSATIFITTATDVFGFLAFLGLASMLLGI